MNTPKTPGQIAYDAFWNLTGSDDKCIKSQSKEWERAAAAVIAHHEASKQPQPKFKVGDRIRRVKNPYRFVPLGYEATVLDDCRYADTDGDIQIISKYDWEKVEWTLPTPPPGRSWHRDDWAAEMLPDGWRPLLAGEIVGIGDEAYFEGSREWEKSSNYGHPMSPHLMYRTRRPPPPAHEVKITLPPLRLTHGTNSYAHTAPC